MTKDEGCNTLLDNVSSFCVKHDIQISNMTFILSKENPSAEFLR